MANLLRFVSDLVRNDEARAGFLADPETAVGALGAITGEDVEAVVASLQESTGQPLRTGAPSGTDRHETPVAAAARHLVALCSSLAEGSEEPCDVIDMASRRGAAVGAGGPDEEDGEGPTVDPTHPSHAPTLAAVPDLDARFGSLDPVLLATALPEYGVEVGDEATIVAASIEDGAITYEIEIRDADGHPQIVRVADDALEAVD